MKLANNPWFDLDKSLKKRLSRATQTFRSLYSIGPSYLVIVPGRAEILGNHTDYNAGKTLSANIERNLLIVASKRADAEIHLLSFNQNRKEEVFDGRNFDKSGNSPWTNYIKGVIDEIKSTHGKLKSGFNAIIDSTIPIGGGVSSSAALELAFVHLIEELNGYKFPPLERIALAKAAENNYVGSPCGYLDQGTIELSNKGWLLINYDPGQTNNSPFTSHEIQGDLLGTRLIIGYDPKTKRKLTEGKYAIRKACCEEIVRLWREETGERINYLSEISSEKFEGQESKLRKTLIEKIKSGVYKDLSKQAGWKTTPEKQARIMLGWASHPINENRRVELALKVIRDQNHQALGQVFSESGKSGIYLFGLSEGCKELEWVFERTEKNKKAWGVIGIRNMGGGFNATTLALTSKRKSNIYKEELGKAYREKFGREYLFIEFTPSPGVWLANL